MTRHDFIRILAAAMIGAGIFSAASAAGEEPRSIHLIGRKEIAVTTDHVRLADVAQIGSEHRDGTDDEAIIALQKIMLDKSPAPGASTTIAAAAILERMRAAGVNLEGVRYTLPRVVSITRAGRAVTSEEVLAAIRSTLERSGSTVDIKSVSYREDAFVAPGITTVEASAYGVGAPGKRSFSLVAKTEGAEDVRFTVQALVEEWKEIPVARRPLAKGDVIEAQDIMRARLNLTALPKDAVQDDENLVGLKTSEEIGYGEFFRRPKLAVPPVVASGSKVTIIYRGKLLEVTATGTALESGIKGQEIKIQNDASKRTVRAVVIEPGIVGVKQ